MSNFRVNNSNNFGFEKRKISEKLKKKQKKGKISANHNFNCQRLKRLDEYASIFQIDAKNRA